jgi:hypothetical protein
MLGGCSNSSSYTKPHTSPSTTIAAECRTLSREIWPTGLFKVHGRFLRDALALQTHDHLWIERQAVNFVRVRLCSLALKRRVLQWNARSSVRRQFQLVVVEDLLPDERQQRQEQRHIMRALFEAGFKPRWERACVVGFCDGHKFSFYPGEHAPSASESEIIAAAKAKCGHATRKSCSQPPCSKRRASRSPDSVRLHIKQHEAVDPSSDLDSPRSSVTHVESAMSDVAAYDATAAELFAQVLAIQSDGACDAPGHQDVPAACPSTTSHVDAPPLIPHVQSKSDSSTGYPASRISHVPSQSDSSMGWTVSQFSYGGSLTSPHSARPSRVPPGHGFGYGSGFGY